MNKQKFISLSLLLVAVTMVQSDLSFAEGDVVSGEKNFKKCAICHSLEEGKKKIGPSLHGLIGRSAGTAAGFKYSVDYLEAGKSNLIWNSETLFGYLEDPKKYLATILQKNKSDVKSRMPTKYKDEKFRKDVIAYLESLKK